jgi:hypothetical protein
MQYIVTTVLEKPAVIMLRLLCYPEDPFDMVPTCQQYDTRSQKAVILVLIGMKIFSLMF